MRAIDQAIAAHRSGNLAEAETLYRRVLAANSRDFDALHMLGIVCAQRGQFEEAEKSLRAANAVDASVPPCLHNHGNVLGRLNRYEEAVASYQKATACSGWQSKPDRGDEFARGGAGQRHRTRPAHFRAKGAVDRRSFSAAPASRSVPRHTALQRPHHGRRCGSGGSSHKTATPRRFSVPSVSRAISRPPMQRCGSALRTPSRRKASRSRCEAKDREAKAGAIETAVLTMAESPSTPEAGQGSD